MLEASIRKNDKLAGRVIIIFSLVIFIAIALLDKHIPAIQNIPYPFSFDVHEFAYINSIINSLVSVLLLVGLFAAKSKKFKLHKGVMFVAMVLSFVFLLSYVCHHIWAGDTHYGKTGFIKYVYYFILVSHIILAAVIMPFVLYTTYRALTAEFGKHRKLAKYTWPLWFYVSVTGVIVYWMIAPYYS
ncbi:MULTISPECIES: DUF420 domain-containing protein [Chitinophagaceae]